MNAATSTELATLITPRPLARRIRTPVIPATGADHSAIACFLAETFDRADVERFKATTDDPFYQPCDRLLLHRGQRITAHAHITRRTMQFGEAQIPVAGLHDLCVTSAMRGQGFGLHLLAAAERRMVEGGAIVGWLKTSAPHFFRRTGWALCGRHNYSRANTRALMAQLLAQGVSLRRQRQLHIRPWRQWDLVAIKRIYKQNLPGSCGPLERTEAYWQWLVESQVADEVFVALEGPEQLDLGEQSTRLIGYAALHNDRIIELMTAPDRPHAALELVGRISADAVERGLGALSLHAPTDHPLHALFLDAGGTHHQCEAERGQVYMARLLDPLALLERLAGEFLRRAEPLRVPRPFDIGLLVEGHKYHVEVLPDRVQVSAHRLGRSYLSMNGLDFTRLLLGQLDWQWATANGRLEVSTGLAQQVGPILFPTTALYRPVWDELEIFC